MTAFQLKLFFFSSVEKATSYGDFEPSPRASVSIGTGSTCPSGNSSIGAAQSLNPSLRHILYPLSGILQLSKHSVHNHFAVGGRCTVWIIQQLSRFPWALLMLQSARKLHLSSSCKIIERATPLLSSASIDSFDRSSIVWA